MSKQFKEGSDFEAAAKVLLGESTEDTLNEKFRYNNELAEEDYDILEAMLFYGEDFEYQLALTARIADERNYIKLRKCFSDLWSEYEEIAEKYPFKGDNTKRRRPGRNPRL